MKSMKELMEELGFNKSGSDETQKAFIKHLIREANRLNPDYKSSAQPMNTKNKNLKTPEKNSTSNPPAEIQLCFDLEDKKQVS